MTIAQIPTAAMTKAMKRSPSRRARKIAVACLLLCGGMASHTPAISGFDDWIKQQLDSAFEDVQTQGVGVWNMQGAVGLSGGGMRVRNKNVPFPFQIGFEMPSVNIGCGGIDYHGGALALIGVEGMNFQQIGQKLIDYSKSVASNAVKLSIKMAINHLSEKLGSALSDVEGYANALNKMSMDSCAAGQEAASWLERSLTKGTQDSRQKTALAGATASPVQANAANIDAKAKPQVNFSFMDGNWTWQLIHSHQIKPANASNATTESTLTKEEIRIAHSLLGARLNISSCSTQTTPTARSATAEWDCHLAEGHQNLSDGLRFDGTAGGDAYRFGTVAPTINSIKMLVEGSTAWPVQVSEPIYAGGPNVIRYAVLPTLSCPDDSKYDEKSRCITKDPTFISLFGSKDTHFPRSKGQVAPLNVRAEKLLRLMIAGLQNTLPGNRAWTDAERAEIIGLTQRVRSIPVYRYMAVMTALQPLAAEAMVDQIKGIVAADLADYLLVSLEKMTVNAYVMAAAGTGGTADVRYLEQVKQRLTELRKELTDIKKAERRKHPNLLDIDQRLRTMEGALLSTMPGGIAGNLGFARQFIGS